MYSESPATRLAHDIEELLTTGPFREFHPEASAGYENPVLDLDLSSQGYGSAIGLLIAKAPKLERVAKIQDIMVMLSNDPNLDARAITLVRDLCPELRHHLTDDAVAREFARRFAHAATCAFRFLYALYPAMLLG